jgi:hypothetical protein
MTRLTRLLSAALAATSVAALGVSAANAAVIVRPTINIPTVRPVLPTVTRAPTLPATHAPTLPTTYAPTLPATRAPAPIVPGVVLPADHVALPPHPTSVVAAELNGKPVIKVSYVNGNEVTVFYLSADAKHVVGAISSISAPATQAPPQNVATAQPVASQPSTPPSGEKVTFTPVKYPEITNATGSPVGYFNAQGQAVYFPNGQMPYGFSLGPNHTIETYIMSTSTATPASKPNPAPAPAPQHPASSKPASSPSQSVTYTPVKYPEITDAYGGPIGYVNAQGQAVYFPNGQMPAGFSIGPNHTIETYIKS